MTREDLTGWWAQCDVQMMYHRILQLKSISSLYHKFNKTAKNKYKIIVEGSVRERGPRSILKGIGIKVTIRTTIEHF